MCVRVDEARQDGHLAMIESLERNSHARRIRRRAESSHASAGREHPSVTNRRPRDGKDPRGTMADQWPVSRAFFSAALRAA